MRHLAASWLCVLLACASDSPGPAPERSRGAEGSAGGAATGFPQPEALDELLEQPLPPDSTLATRFRDVDEWELSGPFPESVESAPRAARNALDAIVDEIVAERAGLVVATASMDCFAREIGRFLVAERGMPAEALKRFAAGRCAVATAPPGMAFFGWTGSRQLDDESAVSTLGAEIEERLRKHIVGGPLEVGVWLHAEGGRVDVVVATGERQVRLDPVATVPASDGRVEIRGELLKPAEWVGALVTRGRFEWSDCEPGEGVALPRFHLVCKVASDDPTARISLEYREPERLLGTVAVSVLARPHGGEQRTFRRVPYAPARAVADTAALPGAWTEVLNAVRASAGLRPLTLDAAQSTLATRMAPYYFAALFGEAPRSVADLVTLGMLAGWKVDGIVQEGTFAWAWQVESLDVSRLLSDILEIPGPRSSLLARDAERIAVGPLAEGGGPEASYAALITSTYTLFSEATHRRDAERVHALLQQARAAQGRSAPGSLEQARPLTVEAAARVQAGEDPNDVLADLIESGAELLQRPVVGWMAETQDLETLIFPEDFLSRQDLDLAVAVPVRRPAGEAWGRYVVLMLASEPPRRSL